MSTDLAHHGHADLPSSQASEAITQALDGLRAIRTFIKAEFDIGTRDRPGKDAGVIPGCGDKPTLFLPGAQKATMYFNAFPTFKVREKDLGGGHVEYRVRCLLVARATGQQIGEGLGCCSTMEKKYRWRGNELACPRCGKPAIRKSKDKPEFYCWRKIGGCGALFGLKEPAIVSQGGGVPVENPDLYDVHNTVLKMAKKRAHVDAAMTLACLSELFTQDIEDTFPMLEVRATVAEPEPYHVDGEVVEPPPARQKGASMEEVIAFNQWLQKRADKVNDMFKEAWEVRSRRAMDDGHEAPIEFPKIIRHPSHLKNHLIKWVRETNFVDTSHLPAEERVREMESVLAAMYHRSESGFEAIRIEVKDWSAKQGDTASHQIYLDFPHMAPDGYFEARKELAEDGEEYVAPAVKPRRKTKRELADSARELALEQAEALGDNPDNDGDYPEGMTEAVARANGLGEAG